MGTDIKRFFDGLLNLSKYRLNHLFRNKNMVTDHMYLNVGGGKTGIEWRYEVSSQHAKVQFYLNHPKSNINKKINELRYNYFLQFRNDIDKAFGGQLIWNFNPNRRAQYIQSILDIDGLDDEKIWPKIWDDLVTCLERLEKALRDYIDDLPEV